MKERNRMMPCKACCSGGGKARHWQRFAFNEPIGLMAFAFTCDNCGNQKINRSTRIVEPDQDVRWITAAEIRRANA